MPNFLPKQSKNGLVLPYILKNTQNTEGVFQPVIVHHSSLFMVVKLAETTLKTQFGDYSKILFYGGQKESIALVMGDVVRKENVLCRVHSACISAHAFNSIEYDCREQMALAQQLI